MSKPVTSSTKRTAPDLDQALAIGRQVIELNEQRDALAIERAALVAEAVTTADRIVQLDEVAGQLRAKLAEVVGA